MYTIKLISFIICAAVTICGSNNLTAQQVQEYSEFYYRIRINAIESIVPCYRVSDPLSAPLCYGVKRDSLGRVTILTRFFFGNADINSEWTSVRIRYMMDSTGDTVKQIRTFHGPNMLQIPIGKSLYSEEIISLKDGRLRERILRDASGKPVNDSSNVCRSMYRYLGRRVIQEQWFISTGKSRFAPGADGPFRAFAPVPPPKVYYRRYYFDTTNIVRGEILLDLTQQKLPYYDGTYERYYSKLNPEGDPIEVLYSGDSSKPGSDTFRIHKETFVYDSTGNVIEQRFFDAKGNPVGRTLDNAAVINYIYRPFDGALLEINRYDTDGKLLPPPDDQSRH